MREREQSNGAENLQPIAKQDDVTAVEAVGHVTGRKKEKKPRKKQRQAGITQIQRPMGDGVNLPGDGYRLRLGAQNDGDSG